MAWFGYGNKHRAKISVISIKIKKGTKTKKWWISDAGPIHCGCCDNGVLGVGSPRGVGHWGPAAAGGVFGAGAIILSGLDNFLTFPNFLRS